MSERNSHEITVLLPAAAAAVFSRDKDTLGAISALAADWRFARVKFETHEGDVETAIRAYQNAPSPSLIIIQTDTTDETFSAKLEKLAGYLSEGAAAIVIGPVNDVYLYRKLIEMGVSDYLVKPVKPDILAQVIGKTLLDQSGAAGSALIAVIGSKGGVGASALAQAMAWTSAEILGEKTLLLDAAGGWSTLGVGMGFEPGATLAEAARAAANEDEDSLKRMIHKASERLGALASGGDALLEKGIDPERFENVLNMLMVKHPVVIVDLSAAPPALKDVVLLRARQIVVTATPALPSLRLARALAQEIRELRGGADERVDLIVNMQGFAPGVEIALGDIEKALEIKPAAVIPFAPKIFARAESEGKKIIDDKEGRALAESKLAPILRKSIRAHGPAETAEKPKGGLLDSLFKKGGK